MSNLDEFIRNATIPNTSDILPASAYYEASTQINSNGWQFGGLGLTHFASSDGDALYISVYAAAQFGTFGLSYIWAGNALSTAEIDSLLAVSAHGAAASGLGLNLTVFDFSGGTNGVPTPAQTHVDAEYNLTFSDSLIGSFLLQGAFTFTFDNMVNFADSSGGTIGVMDSPTGAQVAAYVATNPQGQPISFSIHPGTPEQVDVIDSDQFDYVDQPNSLFDLSGASGITGNQTQSGLIFMPNANEAYLVGQGAIVTTN